MSTSGGPSYAQGTTLSAYLSSSQAGTGAPQNLCSVAITSGTWLVIAQAFAQNTTAALDEAQYWIGPNSASITGAYNYGQVSIGDLAGAAEYAVCSLVAIVTVVANTTVYLQGNLPVACNTLAANNSTLLVALRTA